MEQKPSAGAGVQTTVCSVETLLLKEVVEVVELITAVLSDFFFSYFKFEHYGKHILT